MKPAATAEGLNVRFWGTRGSIPTPGAGTVRFGGNTVCVEVTWGETGRVIFDAGSGIRLLGESLSLGGAPPRRLDIVFSHLHWDHIQGLPFFIPLYVPGVEVHLWGGGGKGVTLDLMMDHQLHSAFFPVGRAALSADILFHLVGEEEVELPGARLRACRVRHPGGCLAFRLDAAGRSVVYATDRESDPAEADDIGLLEPDFIAFARGADLLIHDAQYTDEEYSLYRRGWGHSTRSDAVRVAQAAGVKSLALFHHDPSHDDIQLAADEENTSRTASGLRLFMAAEGPPVRV